MKKKMNPEEIEAILNSLNGLQPTEPQPFFFTRLQARMIKETNIAAPHWLESFLKPKLAFSVLSLMIALNFFTVGKILFYKETTSAKTKTYETQQSFANEYNLNLSDYYTIK